MLTVFVYFFKIIFHSLDLKLTSSFIDLCDDIPETLICLVSDTLLFPIELLSRHIDRGIAVKKLDLACTLPCLLFGSGAAEAEVELEALHHLTVL